VRPYWSVSFPLVSDTKEIRYSQECNGDSRDSLEFHNGAEPQTLKGAGPFHLPGPRALCQASSLLNGAVHFLVTLCKPFTAATRGNDTRVLDFSVKLVKLTLRFFLLLNDGGVIPSVVGNPLRECLREYRMISTA
jgi:hypothetical protein